MSLVSKGRILRHWIAGKSLRGHFWSLQASTDRVLRLFRGGNGTFRRVVFSDHIRFLTGLVRPVEGETSERAAAAVAWLLRAQDATEDDGVSIGYFPCEATSNGHGGWRPSYPETTGYILATLLEYAARHKRPDVRERALRMARWETHVQMASGAVQGGPVCPPEQQVAAVFNTGMVLQGWTAAYRETKAKIFLEAGRKAADFLVRDLDAEGHFRSHGVFVEEARIKTYNCLCAWALARFGEDSGDARYVDAAVRNVEAALGQQQANGWFANNCLSRPEAPLLHTIGYALQGVLEVALLTRNERFLEAARRGCAPLLPHVSKRGFIPARFYADWVPASFSSCLTGNAQLAIVCYRLHEVTGDTSFLDAANRLTNLLKGLQRLDTGNPAIDGAIGGSFPLFGDYMTAGFPNWATKYFVDALLAQQKSTSR
ncbi:MAG: hypothetical protein ACHQ1G_04605 [Planctomycetota bacterium]